MKLLCTLLILAFGVSAHADDILAKRARFNIAAQPLSAALIAFSTQSGVQIATAEADISKLKSSSVDGTRPVGEALELLLKGTGLKFGPAGTNTITIVGPATPSASQVTATSAVQERADARLMRVAQSENEARAASRQSTGDPATDPADEKGTPEILVKGKRSLNNDIQRTEDDPQPYVVFSTEDIQRSQASNLENFLNTRLPMNTSAGTKGQNTPGSPSTVSSINLRGLGTSQTLILVDGRRVPGVHEFGAISQPDINGIPLAAVERIEVLPSTAGGIYGGSATGGVINIILRRDFSGVETKAAYVNTFDSDTGALRLDMSAGFTIEGGRTQVMVSASHSEANTLTVRDRDFAQRGIALQLQNNPDEVTGYPNPPLGRTVNIRSTSGAPLTLDVAYGSRPLGSNITHIPLGYAGPASDSGAALVANAGRYNLEISDDMRGGRRGLMAVPTMHSVAVNLRRSFGERFEAFLDTSSLGNRGSSFTGSLPAFVTNLPDTAPNNPFQQAINVTMPTPGLAFPSTSESKTLRATGGLIARLPARWTGELDLTWSRSRFESRTTNAGAEAAAGVSLRTGVGQNGRPALNALQEGNTFPIDFSPYLLSTPNNISGPSSNIFKHGALRFSGPTLELPGGPLNLSALVERRKETLAANFFQNVNTTTRATTYIYYPPRNQQTDSMYLEARAPLISASNASAWARELELQVSVRRDEYATTSDGASGFSVPSRNGPFPARTYVTNEVGSTDYTVGLRYAPVEDIAFRASFSTGFVAPSVLQVASNTLVGEFSLGPDPLRGNTDTYVGQQTTFVFAGNPQLRPEQSESWSTGLVFTPRFASGLRLSLDYTRIEKTDEIQQPDATYLLLNAASFPGRVMRAPRLPTDPVGWAGPLTYLDGSYLNAANTSVDAYDIQLDYDMRTARFGNFHWYALATWEPDYRNQILPGEPVVDTVGFLNSPLEWRGNAGLTWDKGPLSVSWNAQYYDSYRIYSAFEADFNIEYYVMNQGSEFVSSQVYHDVIATYQFDGASGLGAWLGNSEIAVGLQNVFDKSPPILAVFDGTAPAYSTYGDPRLRRYSISWRKSFN